MDESEASSALAPFGLGFVSQGAAGFFAAAGAGAAVIGCGPIRNWSTGIVRDLHRYIRQEEYA